MAKQDKPPTTEVAVFDDSPFAIVKMAGSGSDTSLQTIMRDNLGSGGITAFDLDRVRVPSGGGAAWELPTLTGDSDVAKTFSGIIVHWREPRAYWSVPLDESGGGTPPDCSSVDGVHGIGDPGGACETCQFAQFGSGKEGRGQKCKQMRLLFIVQEDSVLPIALFAPPTSIGALRKYFLRLASQNKRYSDVVTAFSLSKAVSGGGIEYSRVEVSVERVLSDAEMQAVRAYSNGIAGALAGVQVTAEDVMSTATGGGESEVL